MRTSMKFSVTGKSREEIESKLRERIAKYLNVDISAVDEKTDVEMFIYVGEEGPLQLTFVAECNVKVKS